MKKSIVFSIIMALLLLLSACNTIEGQKDNSETSVAETISESRGPAENQSSDSENVPSEIKERFCDSEKLRVYRMNDGSIKAYVDEWGKEYDLPSTFINDSEKISSCGGSISKVGDDIYYTLVEETSETTIAIRTAKLSKGADKAVCGNTDVDVNCVFTEFDQAFGFDPESLDIGFYEEDHGALFFGDNLAERHIVVMKTTDGGMTWVKAGDDSNLKSSDFHSRLIFAKFINDNEGMASFCYFGSSDMCGHTFVTVDGGKTWKHLSVDYGDYPPSDSAGEDGLAYEVRALDVENGVYKLMLKRYNSTKDLPDVYMTSDRIDSGYRFSETEPSVIRVPIGGFETLSLCCMKDGSTKACVAGWGKEYELPSMFVSDPEDSLSRTIRAYFLGDSIYITNIEKTGDATAVIKSAKLSKNSDKAVCGNTNVELNCVYLDDEPFSFEWQSAWLSFYEDDHGALFLGDNYLTRHLTVLKTADGGVTWEKAGDDSNLKTDSWHEWVDFAKFVSDNEGMVSYSYYGHEEMCDRTFVTIDGGKTWKKLSVDYDSNTPADTPDDGCVYEATSLDVENGVYKLTLRRYNDRIYLPDVYMTSDRIDSGYKFTE